MQVRSFQPSARLAPFVHALEIVEAREEATRTLLPEPGIVIGLRYGGSAALLEGAEARRLPDATVTGLHGTSRRVRTSAGGGVVLVKFREGGAASFLGVPLHELRGETLPMDALVPRDAVERAAARLAEATSAAERLAVLEAFLVSRWRPGPPDGVVQAAIGEIRARRGHVRVGELARRLGLSHDALEKRFRRDVGASPRQLASLLRLRHAVEVHRRGATLSSVPYEAGYYDQSHFIREFRAVTGQPPGRLLAAGELC
ncbi:MULTISPECIES: AraC family transcriptional regulator [unclassified Anaeromyxobacter]|uniref:helix-turn-helix domain-containing protein n=1 Tax=unclassified Anaeromyxobacter TaxID=2620896 RepID=UPI001F59CE79|nr:MULTISPECIES: AraC family transcriptional regulator [unclassified Anaeromyxobacter]